MAQWIKYHGLAIRDRQVGSVKGLLREAHSSSCNGHGTADFHHLDDHSLIHTYYS